MFTGRIHVCFFTNTHYNTAILFSTFKFQCLGEKPTPTRAYFVNMAQLKMRFK